MVLEKLILENGPIIIIGLRANQFHAAFAILPELLIPRLCFLS
jgi:hypothetical protein